MKQAVDAKGNDFVIVSHVKGNAHEVHIGLGQATWKEAEANKEADKRPVQAMQQQTKLMQLMLIEIQK